MLVDDVWWGVLAEVKRCRLRGCSANRPNGAVGLVRPELIDSQRRWNRKRKLPNKRDHHGPHSLPEEWFSRGSRSLGFDQVTENWQIVRILDFGAAAKTNSD